MTNGSLAIEKQDIRLPATLDDLSKFVLIGREKLVSVRAEIRAMDKLNLAKDVREQKKEEAQELADILLDAETRMGELLGENELLSLRDDSGKIIEWTNKLPDGITRNQSSQFQTMAAHRDIVEQVKAAARELDDLPTRTAVLLAIKRLDKPHVSYNSGNNEWYTPTEYIEAARKIMGDIDLDPASSELANTVVKAKQIYTIDDDGLAQDWIGRIWLNPPYSAELVQLFVEKLKDEIFLGNVETAIVLVNNATETQWFRILVDIASVICFPTGRVKFWGIDGSTNAPLQGQAILYIGDKLKAFSDEFQEFGWLSVRC